MTDDRSRSSLWQHVPILRGWINRRRVRTAKRRLADAHSFFSHSAMQEPVAEVRFDKSGCVFILGDGRRYRFDPTRAAGWLYSVPFSGTFERKETDYLKGFVRPGWVCFDVGACFGWYSILFSRAVGATGRVYAFEPVTPNYACLKENVILNESSNVVLENRALGDEKGRLQLYLPHEGVSASFRPHGRQANCQVIETEATTLDEYVSRQRIERLDFLKADIEGAELLLLKGGMQTIERFKPTLLLEVQAHSTRLFGYKPEEVFALLDGLGYRGFFVREDGALAPVEKAAQDQLPDYNFLFKHPKRAS